MPWILCAVLLAASIQDLRRREVSDWFSVGLIVGAVMALVFPSAFAWDQTVAASLIPPGWLGCLLGLVFGSVVGVLLFFLARFGGGDAKLIAAVGCCVGPAGLLVVLAWMALAGMLLSILALLRRQNDIAYVPAIAVGAVVYVVAPGLLTQLMGI